MANASELTLHDLILARRGRLAFRVVLLIFGVALRLFFRRIETVDADLVPEGTGVIFVLNHPNGLIDPALVFVTFPRPISFLAKSTLFRIPVISFLLRTVDALPLYRRIDAGEDVYRNLRTFEVCHDLLVSGGSIALFPEGVSHNSPKLLPLKSGAARIALGAAAAAGRDDVRLSVVPVGLYYSSKTTFRSEAVIHFGQPFNVPLVAPDPDGQPPRDAVRALTSRIADALREVTLNAETDAELRTAALAGRILATTEDATESADKLAFMQRFVEIVGDDRDRERDSAFSRRLRAFGRKLTVFGLRPEHLSLAGFSRGFVIRRAFFVTWRLLLLLPVAAVGVILHFPAYRLCDLAARLITKHGEDDIISTVKVLAAIVFMPLTWLAAGVVTWYFFGWFWGVIAMPLCAACGYAALYFLEEGAELRGWARAVFFFFTSRERFLRLLVERRSLQNELKVLA